MPNYIQPDYRIPTANPAVTVQPHVSGSPSGNPLNLVSPLPRHVEKLSDKDDPSGNVRAGKSGKGSAG
jgi:hypothetical protein